MKYEHDKDNEKGYFYLQQTMNIAASYKALTKATPQMKQDGLAAYFIRQILDNIIELINAKGYLPDYILIVLGEEILCDTNLVRLGMKTLITKLLDELQFVICDWNNAVPEKSKRKALPQIVMTKIIPKPLSAASLEFKSARRKFNKIIESELPKYEKLTCKFLNIGEITTDTFDYFFVNGKLNRSGITAFWLSVANQIKTWEEEGIKQYREMACETDDYLLDDYIQIQAEKLNTHYRDAQNNRDRTQFHYYDNNSRGNRRQSQSQPHANDRYHYYNRNTNNRREY